MIDKPCQSFCCQFPLINYPNRADGSQNQTGQPNLDKRLRQYSAYELNRKKLPKNSQINKIRHRKIANNHSRSIRLQTKRKVGTHLRKNSQDQDLNFQYQSRTRQRRATTTSCSRMN